MPTAIDLIAAGANLSEEYRRLRKLIQQTQDANSIHSDLSIARDMLVGLPLIQQVAQQSKQRPNPASDAALAMLICSIILYVRATKTSSRHRGSISFKKSFSEAEKAMHTRICELRDDAIAHFGPGESYGGPAFQVEGLFIPLDRPDELKIMMASRRIFKQRQLQTDLLRQIEVAQGIAHTEAQRRNSMLVEELNQRVGDEGLTDFFHQYTVDLDSFFEAASEQALAGVRAGRRSGIMDH